jgi:hypothetical protein
MGLAGRPLALVACCDALSVAGLPQRFLHAAALVCAVEAVCKERYHEQVQF